MNALLSKRIQNMAPSATFAVSKKAQWLRSQGHDIIDLSLGEPDFPTPLVIQEAAKKAIDSGKYFGYSPAAGYQDLRQAIAAKLGKENNIKVQPEQIVVCTGAKLALANIFLCLLDPGDEVIVFSPYWVSYAAIIELAGGKPVYVKGAKSDNFLPTFEQIKQAITARTKAILFSSPSNPSGLVLSQSYLEALADLLQPYPQVLVVSDEIYEYINFSGGFFSIGSLARLQDRVVTINGFSKTYAMTGWRVGYLAAPLWLVQACEKLQGQLTAGTCSIAQRAALAALEIPAGELMSIRQIYEKRRDKALECIRSIPGLHCPIPQGAFYLFTDVSHYFGHQKDGFFIKDVEYFCLYVLEKAKVTLVPGTSFGDAGCVRISYAASDMHIQTGLQRMEQVLAQLCPSP
jgi:aspartate aminotransferase